MKKQLSELQAKARLALGSPALVEIASSANSPNKAYELGYLEAGDVKLAMSCQYLATIKRDYGKETFDNFVSSRSLLTSTSNKGTGQKAKEK